jgi:hypothetical protein
LIASPIWRSNLVLILLSTNIATLLSHPTIPAQPERATLMSRNLIAKNF